MTAATAPKNKLLDAALGYARRGWHVYPSPAKNGPAHVKWGTAATTDQQTIKTWWGRWPQALVCISCGPSGLAVIDLDVKSGHNGPALFAELERRHGARQTLMQTTASGGVHLIYRGIIKTTVGVLGDGIDTRGVGGMIVAAPSAGYRMHDVAELGDVLEPADLPQWIADLVGGTSNKPDDADQEPAVELDLPDAITWAIDYLKHHALPAIEGRHGEKTLLMVAATLKDHGISEAVSVDLLLDHYNARCEPPWNVGEGETADRLDVKVHSAWLYLHQTRPGAHTPAAEFAEPEPSIWVEPKPHPSAVKARAEWKAAIADGDIPSTREQRIMRKKGLKP